MIPLDPETRAVIERLFPSAERERVASRLEREVGDSLPGSAGFTAESWQRVRFAVLKLSEGDGSALTRAITLAQTDWRDLLVAAGFADDPSAHRRWRVDGAIPPSE